MSDPAAVARMAARRWGLPEPEHLRTGVGSLWAAGDEVVLRVAPLPFGAVAETTWMARMSSIGVRFPKWVRDIDVVEGTAVVALERVVAEGQVDWAEVGAMVRRVHSIDAADVPGLPWCGDFAHWQIDSLLAEVRPHVDAAAVSGFDACLARWPGWREQMRSSLVVCHGDVHPGNVMPSAQGPVLLDWDMRCRAPAGWDHAALLRWGDRWSDRWGGGALAYDAFAHGYGRSLRGQWITEAMAELRLLVATLMRVRAGLTDRAAAGEAERRLRWWRGDPDAPRWEPQ